MKVCTSCNQSKELIKYKVGRGACNDCIAEYQKKYYAKNKEKLKPENRARYTKNYKRNKEKQLANKWERVKFVTDFLLKNPCVKCGEKDPIVLEFDHIDPSQKYMAVSSLMHSGPMNRMQEEMNKCQILCTNCHRRKTFLELNSMQNQYLQSIIKE